MSSARSGRTLSVVVIIRSFGFPEGMAATNRVRLLSRTLIQQGVNVRVICTRVSERPGEIRTTGAAGVADGIPYLYTPGTAVRSDRFLVRRWRESRGYLRALAELRRLRSMGMLDCVYLADGGGERWSAGVAALLVSLKRLGVPAITELNELPGTYGWGPSRVFRGLSQLTGISGVVAISDWLTQWAAGEARRLHRRIHLIEIPILVDVDEQAPEPLEGEDQTFVYSASNEYLGDLAFVFRSMRLVWRRFPDACLKVTGIAPSKGEAVAGKEGVRNAVEVGRIALCGWVERQALLALYSEATALLIPLHDDLRSRARFPTKLGEYLASGRPVVTCRVGEIDRFLADGETAYVAAPDDESAFSAKMIEALSDPRRASVIGGAGRRVAEEAFSYAPQGPRLREFIELVSRSTL